jgi:hypothetical protein
VDAEEREKAAQEPVRDIPEDGWTGLRKIGRTPAGTAVLADIPSAERNTGEVFVNTAPGTYEVYAGDTGG